MLRIDGRSFELPVFVELGSGMQTTIRFPGGATSAMDLVRQNAEGTPFILLAQCRLKDPELPARLCLFAGRGPRIRSQLIVDRALRFTPDEIRGMTGQRS